MATPNMSLTQSDVGSTPGPTWASNVESNWTALDDHNHASGSGVQITPAGININADVEFNENQPKELKGVVLSNTTASSDNSAVYQSGGDLYWRNAGGVAVQVTSGGTVKTTGGSIDGMSGTDAEAAYGSGIFTWQFDSTKTPFAGAKMSHADINLYKYDASSGSNAYVQMKYTGTSEGSNILTVPDETATLLTTSTSYGGGNLSITASSGQIDLSSSSTLDMITSAGNSNITLTPHGTGSVVISKVDINGGTLGAFTIDGNWTAASQTCANLGTVTTAAFTAITNLGTVTTADLNGGTIDGTVIGGASAAAGTFTTLASTGNTTIGDASGDSVTVNAAAWTFANDTAVTLSGGVDALNFDSNTLSIDATNNRIGLGTAAPATKFHIVDNHPDWSSKLVNTHSGGYGLVVSAGGASTTSILVLDYNEANTLFELKGTGKTYLKGIVGIGATAPAGLFPCEIKGNTTGPAASGSGTTADGSLRLSNTGGTQVLDIGMSNGGYAWIQGTQSDSLGADWPIVLQPNNGGNVGIGATSPASTAGFPGPLLELKGAGPTVVLHDSGTGSPQWEIAAYNQELRLTDDGVDRFKIDSNGNVIVGNQETGKPQLNNVADSAASPAFGFYNDAGLGMYRISGDTLGFTVGGTKRMTMASDGSIGAPSGTNIYNPSDSRLKQNVSSLSGCLAKIKQLKGVSFNWIDGFAVDEKDRTLYGLVAQDAQAVDSNLIEDYGNGLLTIEGVTIDNPLRVNEKFIIPMLIEAMKELSTKVTALEGN
jgi:hypothetical protein